MTCYGPCLICLCCSTLQLQRLSLVCLTLQSKLQCSSNWAFHLSDFEHLCPALPLCNVHYSLWVYAAHSSSSGVSIPSESCRPRPSKWPGRRTTRSPWSPLCSASACVWLCVPRSALYTVLSTAAPRRETRGCRVSHRAADMSASLLSDGPDLLPGSARCVPSPSDRIS